jgi:hypothetical protein
MHALESHFPDAFLQTKGRLCPTAGRSLGGEDLSAGPPAIDASIAHRDEEVGELRHGGGVDVLVEPAL